MTPLAPTLHEYQRTGIRRVLAQPHNCFFWDPGLGKTLAALLCHVLLERKGEVQRTLVVAPLRVAQGVWRQEAAKWEPTADLTVQLLHGPHKAASLRRPADIDVINYEGLLWLFDYLEQHRLDFPWQFIIFDELSKLKAPGTRRHTLLRNRLHRHDERILGLTGTPCPNHMGELYGQMRVVDDGASLGTSLSKFNAAFMSQNPYTRKYSLRPGADEVIAKRIAPTCHRLAAEDHLKMPKRIEVWHELDASPGFMDTYKQMENELLLEFADSEEQATAAHAGVLFGKLSQLSQGFIYTLDEEGQRQVRHIQSTKLDALEDIVEEACGEPILLFYKFQSDLERLQARFPQLQTLPKGDVSEFTERWNRGEIELLACNPMSAGHGLNLQRGGHTAVWYAMESSLERVIQANGRLYRQGQAHPVIIHHLTIPGTVDDSIRDVLQERDTMQSALLKRLSSCAQPAF